MTSPEAMVFKNNEVDTSKESEQEEVTFEEELTDRFVELLDTEPAAKEIIHEIKTRFNEMETVTKRAFDESLDSVRPRERLRRIEMFSDRTALDYVSLHKNITDMLELADHLSEEEKQEVLRESETTAMFYEGHTLLSFYANREGLERKKSIDALTRNTENASLQQSMARFYLRHQENIPDIHAKLDTYGKKAFGSEMEYGAFKRGVVSLADAFQHLEGMGYRVLFPPPRMDAEDEVDLLCVDVEAIGQYEEEAQEALFGNYTFDDLKKLDPSVLEHIHLTQVKTRHNLRETYANVNSEGIELNTMLDQLSFDRRHFDGLDPEVLDGTTVRSSAVESVTHNQSRAAVFACDAISSKREYMFHGRDSLKDGMNGVDRHIRRARDDIQELGTFMGKVPHMGSIYIFVEQEEPPEQNARSFY